MLLSALAQLYDRLKDDERYRIVPMGFSLQKIDFRIVLKPTGELFDIQRIGYQEKNRWVPEQLQVLGKTKPSGSGLNPCFLWDNTAYLLGYDPNKPERAKRCFEASRDYHLKYQNALPTPAYQAVCHFFQTWKPEFSKKIPIVEEITNFGVFQILGEPRYVHEEESIVRFWLQLVHQGQEAPVGQCLVTGKFQPIARIHNKIKGVMGGQGAGSSLVSYNFAAAESYGKTQSYNAPVSEEAAFQYTTALNALLDGPMKEKHRIPLSNLTLAFWTDAPHPVEDIFAAYLSEGENLLHQEAQDESLRAKLEVFLKALKKGKEAYGDLGEGVETTRFYLAAFSPNAGRLSLRFFYTNTLDALLQNLRQHHQDIQVERQHPREPEFPSLWQLLKEAFRDGKDIPPTLSAPFLKSIILGLPYPLGVYAATLRRIQAERRITYFKASLIKGFLNRNLKKEVDMALDQDRLDPAYRLGRLFAVLERVQKDALGENLSSTIRDRFYSSASATPGAVFPRLLRTYQHHLAKLDAGFRIHREKLVQEIVAPLREFPQKLSLYEQGLFALGYYHQTNAFYQPADKANS